MLVRGARKDLYRRALWLDILQFTQEVVLVFLFLDLFSGLFCEFKVFFTLRSLPYNRICPRHRFIGECDVKVSYVVLFADF